MRGSVISLILAAGLAGSGAAGPRVTRALLKDVEKTMDRRLERILDSPYDLLGMTRGVYLENLGAVFTAEVALIAAPTITPFRPEISQEVKVEVHKKKIGRLPMLRQTMREMLVASAASLNAVPPQEKMVLGITLFNHSWEDKTDLPNQILMQASRQTLLDFQANRRDPSQLQAVIQEQTF